MSGRDPINARERLELMVRTTRGNMTVWSPAEVRDALDAFKAEVRAEIVGDIHSARLPTFAASESPMLVAKVVRAVDVRLAAQGPEAPYGNVEGSRATDATPDFFQPGHVYKHAAWTFRCDTVTTHPDTNERTVLGWFRFMNDTWRPLSCSEAEWAEGTWTDITDLDEAVGER